ncbi:hypothetical protein ADT26_13205 [Xanthomonas oryzae]|uniref:hypothetical protein n=1 Tax=Xanthomonas oryzae TaxID=347 RepID=UPI000425AF8B|nr:hypothetical protein [Xanthomonas oryzae]ALS94670.1 hypothetical protein AXO1947_09235 [Xanthomonas oryzae pv. oryzae]AVT99384.1 hypothetical protein C0L89_12135 [Xanthomonas oryzae pv. oryzae]AVU03053.1 hypothetical protein C0L90_12295 [Xanthomonas oryzae pv. oryzae]KOR42937.1 hypothetical protein ADT26_13205 [Xanthomonas oryzae]QBG91945.1 hypothetical protein EYR26_10475 [Xanthomonas oryzae]
MDLYEIVMTLAGFTALYTTLLVIVIKVSLKTIHTGPDVLFPPTQPNASPAPSRHAPLSSGAVTGSAP